MTENFNKVNRTSNYKVDHTRFGGVIYPSDFYTNYPVLDNNSKKGSRIASNIVSDWNFDNQCKRNIEGRSKSKKERN